MMRSMHCMAAILSPQSLNFFYSNETTFERTWAFAAANAARNRRAGSDSAFSGRCEGFARILAVAREPCALALQLLFPVQV